MALPSWVCRVRWDGPLTARRSLAELEAEEALAMTRRDLECMWNSGTPTTVALYPAQYRSLLGPADDGSTPRCLP